MTALTIEAPAGPLPQALDAPVHARGCRPRLTPEDARHRALPQGCSDLHSVTRDLDPQHEPRQHCRVASATAWCSACDARSAYPPCEPGEWAGHDRRSHSRHPIEAWKRRVKPRKRGARRDAGDREGDGVPGKKTMIISSSQCDGSLTARLPPPRQATRTPRASVSCSEE